MTLIKGFYENAVQNGQPVKVDMLSSFWQAVILNRADERDWKLHRWFYFTLPFELRYHSIGASLRWLSYQKCEEQYYPPTNIIGE